MITSLKCLFFCGHTLCLAMISYLLAGTGTTLITSIKLSLTLQRRLGYFRVVFDKIIVRALSCISFGRTGNFVHRFD